DCGPNRGSLASTHDSTKNCARTGATADKDCIVLSVRTPFQHDGLCRDRNSTTMAGDPRRLQLQDSRAAQSAGALGFGYYTANRAALRAALSANLNLVHENAFEGSSGLGGLARKTRIHTDLYLLCGYKC